MTKTATINNTDELQRELISKINALATVGNKSHLLTLINNKEYSELLCRLCKVCRKDRESGIFNCIKYLVDNGKNELDLDFKLDGWTAAGYAAQNFHEDLYYFLGHEGANLRIQLKNKQTPEYIYTNRIQKAQEKYSARTLPEFTAELSLVGTLFSELPSKTSKTDAENALHDPMRIDYIIKVIGFLTRYHKIDARTSNPSMTQSIELVADNNFVDTARYLLANIGFTVRNLSGTLRSQYRGCFKLAPFDWTTLERFGGLMKPSSPQIDSRGNAVSGLTALPDYSSITYISPTYKKHFISLFKECMEKPDVLEAAINDIIETDLPILHKFFSQIQYNQKLPEANRLPIEPIGLINIKILTSYMVDLQNFTELLNLLAYKAVPKNINSYLFQMFENQSKLFDLDTRLGQHAALRYLQMIGELFTGKNLSSFWHDLDSSIDWRAFVLIRDTLCHPDEGNNKNNIDTFATSSSLGIIINEELKLLAIRLHSLIDTRHQRLGYNGDPGRHWELIQGVMKEKYLKEEQSKATSISERRVTLDDEVFFIRQLNALSIDSIQVEEITTRCIAMFDGTGQPLTQRERGNILKLFPKKGDHAMESGDYQKLKDILNITHSKPSTPKKERTLNRQQEQDQKQACEKEKETAFQQFEVLRSESKKISAQSDPRPRVNFLDAAIETLTNISEFLAIRNVKEEDPHRLATQLIVLFERDFELYYAIEYNICHLMQYLDKIRNEHDIDLCRESHGVYENLRTMRNFMEHGDLLLDNRGAHCLNLANNTPGPKKNLLALFIAMKSFKLLADLKSIKDQDIWADATCSESTLTQHDENQGGHSISSISIFSPSKTKRDKKEPEAAPSNGWKH
jgi:uncharacterized protein with HEPN domain